MTQIDPYYIKRAEQILIHKGLPFLLQHHVRPVLREAWRLVLIFIGIPLLFGLIMLQVTPFDIINRHVYHVSSQQYFVYVIYGALIAVALTALGLIVPHVMSALRSWSRVDATLALMLGVVTLSFFLADTWRVMGEIAWWRLITAACLGSAVSLIILFRHAIRAVRQIDLERLNDPGRFAEAVKHWLVAYMVGAGTRPATFPLLGRARLNLYVIVALLFARRVLVCAFAVFLGLFVVGVVVIDRQVTMHLLNDEPLAKAGWSASFAAIGRQFFISEPLLKVALSLGALAAVYFVVVTMTTNPDQAYSVDEISFLREVLALWSCYEAALRIPGVNMGRPPKGLAELREAVNHARGDERVIRQAFARAEVYVLATCSPEEFTQSPNAESLVYDESMSSNDKRLLPVSTRPGGLRWKARRGKDVPAGSLVVIAKGNWLLTDLKGNVKIDILGGWRLGYLEVSNGCVFVTVVDLLRYQVKAVEIWSA